MCRELCQIQYWKILQNRALILHFLLRGQSILLANLLTSYIVILFAIAVGWSCEKIANDLRIGSDNKRNSEIPISVSSVRSVAPVQCCA